MAITVDDKMTLSEDDLRCRAMDMDDSQSEQYEL